MDLVAFRCIWHSRPKAPTLEMACYLEIFSGVHLGKKKSIDDPHCSLLLDLSRLFNEN